MKFHGTSQNHWAVLNRSNHTCQKHKVWRKGKYGQCERDIGHLSSCPLGPLTKRWRVFSAHVHWVRGTASHTFIFHISWGEVCEQWKTGCYPMNKKHLLSLPNGRWPSTHPTLLATPCKWKSKGVFEQLSQRLGNHRTGVCHTCRGVRSLRKMIYHEVWDLSLLQTAELWFG